MVDHELTEVLRSGPFEHALRAAIRARGLSLDRLHARLRERGVRVSLSSLSYWQRGRSRPERPASLAAVRELEAILALPDYSLIGLLGPPRPRGGLAQRARDPLAVLSHHEQVTVDPERGRHRAHARTVLRATVPGVDRHLVALPPGATLLRAEYCRVGRSSADETGTGLLTELIFDRPLAAGETHVAEYWAAFSPAAPRADRHERRIRVPVGQDLVQVRFKGARLPVRCFHTWSPDASAPPRDAGELRVDAFGAAHLLDTDVRPGVRGIRWEWV
ncbi:hypothetical protein Mco01_05640 [Microbispora corallina]|uniref:XRE family transcriptional regulator n=1 Tax=Microbispora corallina TaxID=83302 RepID=A0ABQ4FRV8_9ACTN|nr:MULTISPECIES: hypothetical protein [Microbispora]ETK35928.1 hypothetical protein MPTA5024_11455 [Microbispora sp. ATCC PTA-5024]GIH37564.1 hypothetical protein Mco01_05640 [Microbispora corallina]